MFKQDEQDQLEMGFNATFDVQVVYSGTMLLDVQLLTAEHRLPKN
jgi:hypothetical protein